MIETKISNLESNLFIEIDIERIEDRSKALSSIGIELADSLKTIPAPIERVVANVGAQSMVDIDTANNTTEYEEVNFDELNSFEDNKEAIKDEINRLTISGNQKKIEEEKERLELEEKLDEINISGMYSDDNIDFENEDSKDEAKSFEEKIKTNSEKTEEKIKEKVEGKKEETKKQDNEEIEMNLAEVVEEDAKEKVHVLNLDNMLEEENTKLEHVSMATDNHNDNVDIHDYETEEQKLIREVTKEVKPSFFKRIWNAITYMFKVKVVLDLPSNTENENS